MLKKSIENIIKKTGQITSWLSLILVLVISIDVFLRYIFNYSTAGFYELEWHLFACIFILGSSYTLQKNRHVRVDVFYNEFNDKTITIKNLQGQKGWINLIGTIVFLLPFSYVIIISSIPFVENSYLILESSPDQGGLPFRFIIKSIIPIGFTLFFLQGCLEVIKHISELNKK